MEKLAQKLGLQKAPGGGAEEEGRRGPAMSRARPDSASGTGAPAPATRESIYAAELARVAALRKEGREEEEPDFNHIAEELARAGLSRYELQPME